MDNFKNLVYNERTFPKWKKIFQAITITLAVLLVIITLYKFDYSIAQDFITQNPKQALIISFFIVFLLSITLIPTSPFTIFLAVLISPLTATIIATLANTLSALLHYQIGKNVGDVFNFEEKKAGLPFHLGKLPMNSPLILLIGRVIPGGPKGLSFICGAYRVPAFPYFWTTLVTNLIGASLIAFGGNLIFFPL